MAASSAALAAARAAATTDDVLNGLFGICVAGAVDHSQCVGVSFDSTGVVNRRFASGKGDILGEGVIHSGEGVGKGVGEDVVGEGVVAAASQSQPLQSQP